jgi:hypothetical protein
MAKGRGAHAKSKGGGRSAEIGPSQTTLHQGGMKNRSAANPDSSMRCSGGSVDSNPTRGETARTPRSLGPRSA